MKTKAMVLEKFNQPLVLREFELPALQSGEVLIRMEAAGVCGSDVHMAVLAHRPPAPNALLSLTVDCLRR